MSIQDNGGPISYADHDVHHIRHEIQWRSNADSGPTDALEDIQQFEITERGLDPDELAELRAMRVMINMYATTTVNQGNPGTVDAQIEAGFNLSGDEFILKNPDSNFLDVDDSGTDDFIVSTKDTDEVGQLYAAREDHTVAFNNTTDGVGGGGDDSLTHEMLNFADLFGSGPFVDAADDFSSRIELGVNDVLETVAAEVVYSMYYNVEQTEGGRSRFGR